MSERKGDFSYIYPYVRLLMTTSSVKQVLSPGLRSCIDSPAERSQKLTAGSPSDGTILNVCLSFSSPRRACSSWLNRRCNTCGEYIYKGKKFNARKETVEGEDYHGIKIFRFYIKWYVTIWSDPRGILMPWVVHYVLRKSLSRRTQ